jgi:flagellar basal body-associated protein FliL
MSKLQRESHILHPSGNGARVPRCQAISKHSGQQCKRMANEGYSVCTVHGAGSKKRVKEGRRNAAGRPPVLNFYSRQGKAYIKEAIQASDASDAQLSTVSVELSILRAALRNLLEHEPVFEKTAADIKAYLESAELDIDETRNYAQLLTETNRFMRQVRGTVLDISKVVKTAVEIENRTAQEKALAALTNNMLIIRDIIMENFTHVDHQYIYEEFKRRITEKNKNRQLLN